MNIFAPLIKRPVGTSLLALGLLLAGLFAYRLLGVAALPSLEFPGVYIVAQLPGASAQTMASTVLAPLERHIGRIPGIDDMYGNAAEGTASIQVRFTFDRTADKAARDVQAAINAAQADLPVMPSPPQYFKFDTSQIPILLISLTSTGLPQDKLYDLTDTLLKPAVAQVPGVAQVQVFGGTPHAVRVELDINALAAKGLTANDVRNALIAANVTSPQGILTDGQTQMTVTANDGLREAPDFANLLVSTHNGAPVRLSDVAKVVSGQQDIYQGAWFNGKTTVAMQISKRPEANAVETVEEIRRRLPEFRAWMPADVQITPIFDLTQTTKSALHEVEVALLISIVMVVLVMLVFLRRMRPTLIASLSVPLSLAGAFVVMLALGYTLNTLSLVALVLCIGFVVDDAIVVIENIVRHMEKGESPLQAALIGVREIGFTVVSITLSLVAVFAPLLFGNNMLIMLLREFSVTLAVAVVISAIVSLTLTPALCGKFLKHEEPGEHVPGRLEAAMERLDRGFHRIYERALDWAMHHRRLMRWQPLLLLAATFALGAAVVATAGGNFMPEEDTGMLEADMRADANISPAKMAELAQQAAVIMQKDRDVQDVLTTLGGNDGSGAVGNQGTMFVDLKTKGSGPNDRHDGAKAVMERLSKQFDQLPGMRVSLEPVQFIGGGGSGDKGTQYEFQLIGSNGEDLQPWTLKMVQQLRKTKGMRDVGSNFDLVGKQQMLKVDREPASRLLVSMGDVDTALLNSFGQRQVSVIYSDINQYWVVLTSSSATSLSPESLLNVRVRNAKGEMIPLSALAHIEPNMTPMRVRHHNQLAASTISYNLDKGVTQDVGVKLVENAAIGVGLPEGVRVEWTGQNQRLQQAKSNGMVLLIGAIVAMYIVLGILYESLGHPLTILSTLPAAGAGAFLAMLVTQTQLTLMAIIAILMLIGIVKKNAILMVDFALVAQRERGLSPPEAIREAALVRFRPITMTTLVAMGAALPLAIGFGIGSEMRQPLGVAIVGGLLVSQMLTLLSTPAIYLWNFDRLARHAKGLMPGRLQWTSGLSIFFGVVMVVVSIVYAVKPDALAEKGMNGVVAVALAVLGAALVTSAVLTLRKKPVARYVMAGLVFVAFGLPALGLLLASLSPQGGSPVAALLPGAIAAYAGWAVFSRRTRNYFGSSQRPGFGVAALKGA
ncbi:AcrB/AcrD/AcrF family protein [Dyella solisilvae]|uniref:AcrB/AcrD/AcrF family protein n=1 Tax=Dyella solisilvae TaxID=1920168 RepID=A0A370K8S1_9GAMM|nr:efflux RND transporter permease subunit [Dyella solisilvae]RDI99042.1 AcrB/AcrD/AcrF family protein [Dyella solisilvae]